MGEPLGVAHELIETLILFAYKKSQLLDNNSSLLNYYFYPTETEQIARDQSKSLVSLARSKLKAAIEEIDRLKKAPSKLFEGGRMKASQKQSNAKHEKTAQKYKGKDGVERVLYRKGETMYVKKKSSKTGKMVFTRVKA